MKFHPTLFSTPMVIAIGDGTKTQTRRTKGLESVNENPNQWKFDRYAVDMAFDQIGVIFSNDNKEIYIPFKANIGDIFWVRESFYAYGIWIKKERTKTGKQRLQFVDHGLIRPTHYRYMDNPPTEIFKDKLSGLGFYKRNSLFMPKPAARYFLKIKSIKVERLQEITEADAKAEGAKDTLNFSELDCMKDLGKWIIPRPFSQHQFRFLSIWCNINGPENWLSNPFVWVYEFEKIEKPDNFIV